VPGSDDPMICEIIDFRKHEKVSGPFVCKNVSNLINQNLGHSSYILIIIISFLQVSLRIKNLKFTCWLFLQFSALLFCWEVSEGDLCCDVPNLRLVYEAVGSIHQHSLVWGEILESSKNYLQYLDKVL